MTPADLERLARLTSAELGALKGYLLSLLNLPALRQWEFMDPLAVRPHLLGDRRQVHLLGAPRSRAADRLGR